MATGLSARRDAPDGPEPVGRRTRRAWTSPAGRSPVERPAWWVVYPYVLVVLDGIAMAVASEVAIVSRFGADRVAGPYSLLTALAPPFWVAMMGLGRAYERRFVGVGTDEFRRVFDAAVRTAALTATFAYAFRLSVSRGFVGVSLPLATLLTLVLRYAARKVLHKERARSGRWSHRVLAVGSPHTVTALVQQTRLAAYAGMDVTGVLLVGGDPVGRAASVAEVPVLGGLDDLVPCLEGSRFDTVAVTDASALGPQALRRIAWALEGRGVDLVVSPSLTDVAGPRIHVRPVAGLTLLHVEEPQLSGARLLVKTVLEKTLALLGLVVISPFLAVLAVLIKTGSPGPVLFRQTRVGKDGAEFEVLKFRSMQVDAEERLVDLQDRNESDGLLFKMRDDPRVTRVGAFLRRYSLDELPQVWNVLRGDMSLIGPRPPLPSEVEAYGSDVRRRLLVKPGMTGLWQTSGRSDLTWEEAVRLDLFYVENWSIVLDAQILWRTVAAVLTGRGAY